MILGWGLLIATILVAELDWVAVVRGWNRTEAIAKPGTIVLLFAWLAFTGGFAKVPLIFFGLGLFFSLAGDIFLLKSITSSPSRWFLLGLVAFLLAHVAYILGLNIPLGDVPLIQVIGIGLLLAVVAWFFLGRILSGIREKGQSRLAFPVLVYGMVISLMLLSAILTLLRYDWLPDAAILVFAGAAFFYISDIILAWNKYVKPIRNGRVFNMVTYHLGQIGLIAGVILQFSR